MSYFKAGASVSSLGDLAPRDQVSQAEVFRFAAVLLVEYLPSLFTFIAASLCSVIGIRLLRASGAATVPVIAPQDYEVLAPAIRDGNEKSIDLYVRLSSLTGVTGTFTKIGFTGLPLATLILTALLCVAGIFNDKIYDLAKLTLGAFLGSFVQRQSSTESGREVAKQAAKEAIKAQSP